MDEAVGVAHEVTGVLSHVSAALHHGWAVQVMPEVPDVTVRRKRRLRADQLRRIRPHYADLHVDDISGPATSKVVTLQQCLRTLPFSEALAIADSALRAGDLHALTHAARLARGAGSARVRRIVSLARRGAATPFESALRAITVDVAGWIVLRFAWEDVMHDPEFVCRVLDDVVTRVREQAQRHCACCTAA